MLVLISIAALRNQLLWFRDERKFIWINTPAHVDEACEEISHCWETTETGKRFNIGSGGIKRFNIGSAGIKRFTIGSAGIWDKSDQSLYNIYFQMEVTEIVKHCSKHTLTQHMVIETL